MNELTREVTEVVEHKEHDNQVNVPKSLAQQRMDLCLRLQANRRLLARKLVGPESENQFPRSAAMRFISNHSTSEILHKAANAALGLQTYRALRWGVTALKFVRNRFRKI
jgi:hypothetical protein